MTRLTILAALLLASCKPPETVPATMPPTPPPPEETPPSQDAFTDTDDGEAGSTYVEAEDDIIRIAWECEGPEKTISDLCSGCKTEQKLKARGAYMGVRLVTSMWSSPAPGKQMNTSYALAIQTKKGFP